MGILYPSHRHTHPRTGRHLSDAVRFATNAGLLLALCCISSIASAAPDPATTFVRNCSSCHTFGRGVLVGPDLKGVGERHDRKWLIAWISSSDRLIQSGDPAAAALFGKFKKQRMPDQRLTPREIDTLLDYLAAGGPERDAQNGTRGVETATPAEIERGRALFTGQRAFTHGGAPCASCHSVGAGDSSGGTLGPDLSHAYPRYRDRGMSGLLSRGCFPRVPSISGRALTEQELFELKAFLRVAAMEPR
jgi:mono/diheme cytochrome c family protein